ncbi:tRNA wybutosine-synthesizing protein [Sporothrix brasiliensis 5110]|uniref:tRNA(Phe) (4-demethylwyosine(37)-C(7)) aminocarboxypropyltransferase n=1 Tax=Sporothrix brasiliensis 5110 TaxID=1398154 RepID=A0A0C2F3Q2_9PEZI|nr:tRNA wybutosine-synthesizing protein [Sporothrix brasiliensis 5110]KIH93544.1 tRNA wybutosine-synthesizing protein [Sporothrix brasiliensis 5110]
MDEIHPDIVNSMEIDMDATPTQEVGTPTRQLNGRAHAKDGRPKKPKPESRLAAVVRCWLTSVLPTLPGQPLLADVSLPERSIETLVAQAPKRWVVYEPMVLLPTGSFSFGFNAGAAPTTTSTPMLSTTSTASVVSSTSPAPPLWQDVLAAVSREQQDQLWRDILLALSPPPRGSELGEGVVNNAQLTHLAVNEGIPLRTSGTDDAENILRSPTGLRLLYGDFGPATTENGGPPTATDFRRTFWVSTKQNGLYQTWAPRWSMFSRGNIKEKARLLDWQHGDPNNGWAVDLYAGIGYFVFSYAQRGLRVLGWELNPWSAEALRRGAARNGWSARVVRRAEDLARPTADVVFSNLANDDDADETSNTEDAEKDRMDGDNKQPEIVIFVEDNVHAARRLAELRTAASEASSSPPGPTLGHIVHANCGLLPTSRDTWRTAFDAVVGRPSQTGNSSSRTGWLHLHENVGVQELSSRQAEIQALVAMWASEVPGACVAVVEHVEQVKTFAPGVWHCVFDVRIAV